MYLCSYIICTATDRNNTENTSQFPDIYILPYHFRLIDAVITVHMACNSRHIRFSAVGQLTFVSNCKLQTHDFIMITRGQDIDKKRKRAPRYLKKNIVLNAFKD